MEPRLLFHTCSNQTVEKVDSEKPDFVNKGATASELLKSGVFRRSQQARAVDALQPPPRCGFRTRLKPGVDMICIVNDRAKSTYQTVFRRLLLVQTLRESSDFPICTQGKS